MTRISVDSLFDRLFTLFRDYPAGVCPVPVERDRRIRGRGFFPGGDGLASAPANRYLPIGGVMVLGNNFGCWEDFQLSVARGREDPDGDTWKPLLALLGGAIDLQECFFTNAYVGIIEGDRNSAQMSKTPIFRKTCRLFLTEQIRTLRPRLIMAMGGPAIRAVGSIAGKRSWRHASVEELDRTHDNLTTYELSFGYETVRGRCAAFLHPSYWGKLRDGRARLEFERDLLVKAKGEPK